MFKWGKDSCALNESYYIADAIQIASEFKDLLKKYKLSEKLTPNQSVVDPAVLDYLQSKGGINVARKYAKLVTRYTSNLKQIGIK